MALEKMISKLSKQELIDLVLELAQGDEDIHKKLEYKLETPNDEVKASKQLIRKYINENKRRGFISWRNVHSALQGAEMVLEKGRDKLVNDEEETAIHLGLAVLSVVIDMFQYTDDTGGEIGYVVNKSITLLKDASSMVLLSSQHREQGNMFDLILNEAMNKRYDGWNDWRLELLEVCTIYSARISARKKLEQTLDKLYTQVSTHSSWSSDYELQLIKQLQLKILERNGELEKAQQFILENLQFDNFREMAIQKEIENENYKSALILCEDGEEIDNKYPGRVKKWKQYRLQVYELQENIEKQQEILLEFVYDNEYEAYRKLKELYSPEEWAKVSEEIFEVFENQSGYLPHVYEYIAKAENRSDKILKYCEKSPSTVSELYPYLIDDYADRVEEIFITYIQTEAENAANRKQYRSVCKKLRTLKIACGKERFTTLVQELKEIYQRKPAFVNELEKVEN
ncbi:hypothetical protein D8M04_11700 [Oceanobacillus piezotolerans]|uniref:Uncharacterized protein n=1 Tax=Oceanobacillus piezotolerans TaxID=2448030 RepID=A0A498D430_9BACI|nr:hypothetical protein [Oceanobacillus piezotolerans]RLL43586.1 hypothetical protein D8M04_11700 [Oceanobacillus piezotolerans]